MATIGTRFLRSRPHLLLQHAHIEQDGRKSHKFILLASGIFLICLNFYFTSFNSMRWGIIKQRCIWPYLSTPSPEHKKYLTVPWIASMMSSSILPPHSSQTIHHSLQACLSVIFPMKESNVFEKLPPKLLQ